MRLVFLVLIIVIFVTGCNSEAKIDATFSNEEAVQKGNSIYFSAQTNLPEGMNLTYWVISEGSYNFSGECVISDGKVNTPLLDINKESNLYKVQFSSLAKSRKQSEEIKAIIGTSGGEMTGNYVNYDSKIEESYVEYNFEIIDEDAIAVNKLEQLKSVSDKEIYEYMMNQFEIITKNGDNYEPEIHDQLVLEIASEHFGIPLEEIDIIFLNEAMKPQN